MYYQRPVLIFLELTIQKPTKALSKIWVYICAYCKIKITSTPLPPTNIIPTNVSLLSTSVNIQSNICPLNTSPAENEARDKL